MYVLLHPTSPVTTRIFLTGTCFIQTIYAPSFSLLQGKHLPFTPSPLRLNIFRLFVILSLTQLYRYTPEIFLFSTATFKYKYRAPLRRIGQEYSAKVAFSIFQSLQDFKHGLIFWQNVEESWTFQKMYGLRKVKLKIKWPGRLEKAPI